jgi:peroxiredoxin Q/BCP
MHSATLTAMKIQPMKKQLRLTRLLSILVFALGFQAVAYSQEVPTLTLKNQDGQTVQLKDQRGHFVLYYFYPKDDTPGCTKQACALRDSYNDYKKEEVTIYGVSTQSVESHRAFKAKHRLPFDLLADENGALGAALGVKKIPILGIYKRQSVLVGPDGKVAKFFEDVDPATHHKMILDAVRELRKK